MDLRNVVFAIALSFAVLFGWSVIFESPQIEEQKKLEQTQNLKKNDNKNSVDAATPSGVTRYISSGLGSKCSMHDQIQYGILS